MTQTAYPIDADAGSPSYAASIGRHAGVVALQGSNAAGRRIRSSVKRTSGNDLQVSVAGDDVVVQSGIAVIDGSASFQGAYTYVNDATVTLADVIGASHATLTRIDTVYVRVFDDLYDSSGQRAASIVYAAGTPSGSPQPPALPLAPATSMKVADIQVGPVSGGSVITVLDRRKWLAGQGGLVACQTVSDTNRGILDPVTPTLAFEESGGRVKLWNGSAWLTIYDPNESWNNITLASGFTDSGGANPAYRLEGGWVNTRGRVARNSGDFVKGTPYTIANLPLAIRPSMIQYFEQPTEFNTTGGSARIEIQTGGNVIVSVHGPNDKVWAGLDGMRWTPGA